MKAASKTDAGRVRANNEDSILIDQESGIFLLADGMGGHNAGEVASRLAVDTVHDFLKDIIGAIEGDDEILHALDAAVMKANETVREKAGSDINLSGMGTTLVVLVVKNKKAYLCHAGDSRAYLFRGKLKRLTKDHTVGDSYVEKGYMTREQVPPQQWHMLTQSVGTGNDLVPDKKAFGLKSGDILLLCSDGLTNMLTDDEIAAILSPSPLSSPIRDNAPAFPLFGGPAGAGGTPSYLKRGKGELISPPLRGGDEVGSTLRRGDPTRGEGDVLNMLADSLVAEANNKGGRDNISVVIVQYEC